MRNISIILALIGSLFALPAEAANFSAKDASAATIVFVNPQNCTTGCVPIFSWYDSTGANAVAVLTAGADGASNTANGGLTYNRNLVFNGTTWDRWQGFIKGASGAFAAGSFAAGAGVDGWDLTEGAIADAAVAAGASGSVSAKLRAISSILGGTSDAPCASGSTTPCSLSARAAHTENLAASALPAQTTHVIEIGAVTVLAPVQNTIAASQTAQVMSATQGGGTGVAGDYLSHCNIQPGTTSPGAFSILNNSTVIYAFPGGASSVSNLVGWSVPIGSPSVGGGWKITTTTNITGTCFGKFS